MSPAWWPGVVPTDLTLIGVVAALDALVALPVKAGGQLDPDYVGQGRDRRLQGSSFDYGNAVILLTPGLTAEDYFSPANWHELNRTDGDLGSLGPALLPDGRILIAGKDGTGYLLDGAHLGHVGGQQFAAPLCTGAYGTAAVTAALTFVPCSDGLVAVRVTGGRFDVAWQAAGRNVTSPIVAAGAVWAFDGDGRLTAYDPATGAVRFTTPVGPVTRFTSAAAARGTLVAAAGTAVTGLVLR